MLPRRYAIAFRALHLEGKVAHVSVEIVAGQSKQDVLRRGMLNIQAHLTAENGWSDWTVIARRVPPRLVERVIEEAKWYDPTGAHRLYCAAISVANGEKGLAGFAVACLLAFNKDGAREKISAYVQEKHPEADGWILMGCDIEEFTVRRRASASNDIRWVPRGTTTH